MNRAERLASYIADTSEGPYVNLRVDIDTEARAKARRFWIAAALIALAALAVF